jgi:DNA (cytosine-5)-methyltransferase 1
MGRIVRHGSLFSGIGGFDLAATWVGWANIFQCEKDPFCRKVLTYYWPEARRYDDIKQFDAAFYRGVIDIITGGFPCQPFSVAGKRKGTSDDRHLWPEMHRIVKQIQPRWVVAENVLGLLNWQRGVVFEQVQADLEALGYEVWSFVLPACSVDAPHIRNRVWIIAHAPDVGKRPGPKGQESDIESGQQLEGAGKGRYDHNIGKSGSVTDTNSIECVPGEHKHRWQREATSADGGQSSVSNPGSGRLQERDGAELEKGKVQSATDQLRRIPEWKDFPTQSPLCSGNDGVPRGLDGITFPSWRMKSVSGYGNAIVPQVVLEIFKVIDKMENGGI